VVHRNEKSRYEVRGSRRKVRPQKGWGMSRVRDRRSPVFRGGGRAFPKKTIDYRTDLPSKVIAYGVRSVLAARFKENQLHVIRSPEAWKTPVFLQDTPVRRLMVIYSEQQDAHLLDNAQESHPWTLQRTSEVNVYDLLRHQHLILTEAAVRELEEQYYQP
jgi:large subunit ribosomal protein L4